MDDRVLKALDATVKEIQNMSKEELDQALRESESSPFAQTVNELRSFYDTKQEKT